MTTSLRWTSADLDAFPDDGKRREIIDGELYVTKQPNFYHQLVCSRINALLDDWSLQNSAGLPSTAPGVIFAEDEDVAPDVVWASNAVLAAGLDAAGHLHLAPELAVEVLSPGKKNIQRDREAKLKLYARQGVAEYWIVDWTRRTIDVFRRDGELLVLAATLGAADTLLSPLLPGFAAPVARVFAGLPEQEANVEPS
jgi:Uma2 family endonuclease